MTPNFRSLLRSASLGGTHPDFTQKLEDPLPHLREAKDALFKVVQPKRDLWMLDAELNATRQAKRAGYGALARAFLAAGGILTLFWASMGLHDRGWPAFTLSLASFLLFGALATLFTFLALPFRKGR